MAREISPYAADKRDFKLRFEERCKEWLENLHSKRDVVAEEKYLTTGTLKKRVMDETAEDDRVETGDSLPDPKIHGFNNEIKSLKNFLLDQKVYNDFKSLVVVGEYGVGKTALCKKIFNDTDVKSVYVPRIWVFMHSNESEEGLDGKICVLKKILKGLGVEEQMLGSIKTEAEEEWRNKQEAGKSDGETAKEKELSALLYALHLNLRWKKYLIVFDDVREEDNWNERLQDDEEKLNKDKKWGKYLSDGFPKGSGGRVIYTTRDEKNSLAKKLVAEKHEIHRLWPLTDSESVWKIYEEALEENEDKDPPRNDKKCIDELMNKSRGLPLAVRLMATLLPVFLDDEKTEQNDGSNKGAAGSADNVTPEENTPQPA